MFYIYFVYSKVHVAHRINIACLWIFVYCVSNVTLEHTNTDTHTCTRLFIISCSRTAVTALRNVCQEFILSIGYKLKTMKSIDWHLLFGFPHTLSLSFSLSVSLSHSVSVWHMQYFDPILKLI